MKARLETRLDTSGELGIVIESETAEEAERLTSLWCGKARIQEWERRPGGQIRLAIAPTEERQDVA